MNSKSKRGALSPCNLFTMVNQKANLEVFELLRERKLKPMDLGLIYYLCNYVNLSNSKISLTPSYVSEELGIRLADIQMGFKRLRDNFILGKGATRGVPFFMLNPRFCHIGDTNLQDKRLREFHKLFD